MVIEIPIENFYEGAVLDLETDPMAFSGVLYFLKQAGPLNTTIEEAYIVAVATSGVIHVDEIAEPCQGSSCDLASGTAEIDFIMLKGEIDPEPYN